MVWNGTNYPQEYPDDCEGQCMCRACTACIAVVEQERDEAVAARDAALRMGAFTAMKYTQQLEVGAELEAENAALRAALADAIDAHTPDDVLAAAQALLARRALR